MESTVPLIRPVKALFYLLGMVIIALALLSFMTSMDLGTLFHWLESVFSAGFVLLYLALIATGLWSCRRLADADYRQYWFEVGSQAADAIATLALTFTLLGISLGIGSLSDSPLTPDTVNEVIGELTKHFSTAFMTSVIGLPSANLLRAALAIRLRAFEVTDKKKER